MTVLIYLIPAALLLGLIWLIGFLWSLHNGQYEDLDGAALRVLDDSDIDPPDTRPGAIVESGETLRDRTEGG